MSRLNIRAALEVALNAMAPALATAWENQPFQPPVATTAYQKFHLMFADPDNREAGAAYQERGYAQVTLMYPIKAGPADAEARASAVLAAFRKGSSFSSGGYTVVVDRTPAIGNGTVDGDRWSLPVKIPFHADISS